MRTIADPAGALARGLAAIRTQYGVPTGFPAEVTAAATVAAQRKATEHEDWTGRRFVTLDPAASTDLDQAFAIETAGGNLLLHYAIADVGWFVADDDPVDREAWRRGETLYLPDGKAPLYPPVLSQGAASLLPDGPRPAAVFTVRVAPDGGVRLDAARRAVVRSAAKLAYDSVEDADLPAGFVTLAERIAAAETRRGASRVDPPAQEVEVIPDGRFALAYRSPLVSERRNAVLSLAANLAIADALAAHRTGLFRVMPGPDEAAVARLRHVAAALGRDWPSDRPLAEEERRLDPAEPRDAAFMLAVRRAGGRAGYAPFRDGVVPWHAAVAATYTHATAPLRRLADRYVVEATLAICAGRRVPDHVASAFEALPPVMAHADARAGEVERAVIDLAEAVMLADCVGCDFAAVVIDADDRGARIQLRDVPVVARLAVGGLAGGQEIAVRLVAADPATRTLRFTPA